MSYEDNDYELMYLVSENNEEAYNVLLNKYKPLLFKESSKYFSFGQKIGISRDDILQESLCAFYGAIKYYNDENSKFITFLTLCVNRSLKKLFASYLTNKNSILNNSLCIDELQEEAFYIGSNYKNNPLNDILYYDFARQIIIFKNNLDFVDAQVFELRSNDFSYKDIAILLNLTFKQIDNKMFKIRKKLKSYLNDIESML